MIIFVHKYINMKKLQNLTLLALIALLSIACTSRKLADGEYNLYLLTTNDVHGTWFDAPYVFEADTTDLEKNYVPKNSLLSLGNVINAVRESVGAENVLLIDAGDCLQGDNAAFYFNYIDTNSVHLFSRLVNYLKYDAIVVGNHDIETGHAVYDRVKADLENYSIPFLAGNALKNSNNKPYFQPYTIIQRGGLKVALLGYTNPNIKGWLSEELWSGMHFESLIPLVQDDVNKLIKREKPNVVIVAVHAGVGDGDGSSLESQGLDLFNSLKGVDFLICSHDHKPFIIESDTLVLINSGSHSRNVGYGELNLKVENGKIVEKKISAKLLPATADVVSIDSEFKKHFEEEYNQVKEFTLTPVGELEMDI